MRSGRPEPASGANVIRAAHGEYRVTDLDRAREFYVDVLGFVETERTADALYLRGYEERAHHSLVLRLAESAGAGHLAYRVADGDDLEWLERFCRQAGLATRWVEPGEEAGQGRAVRVQDPLGLPLEFVAEMEPAERLLQRFDLYRGAQVQRFDHFNCQVPDVDAAYAWYADGLGFGCSEYTVNDAAGGEQLWAVWLQRKQSTHDLALMNGIGPRVHHLGFWVADALSVLRACDVLAGAGWHDSIERGPGRHGITNALFLYLRDPDGNRIELFASDYQVADPDHAPLRWTLDDPRRATFWGHAAPASWFEEAARCESVTTGALLPVSEPALRDRPTHVT
jgi:3,4-dihydroxyphenylacetate 2,3-dioxygenase